MSRRGPSRRELLRLLDWATTYVELDTRRGAQTNPIDWPRHWNGRDPDPEVIARECRAALDQEAQAKGERDGQQIRIPEPGPTGTPRDVGTVPDA
jgi:hypothetical protein